MTTTVEFVGGPELVTGLHNLTDVRELVTAGATAARALQAQARDLAPSATGTLAASVDFTEGQGSFQVGSNSPYARWFHVPRLSDGGVTYAKKVSSRGRGFGQRIPDNPFLILAVEACKDQVFAAYVTGTGQLVDRALASVPRG